MEAAIATKTNDKTLISGVVTGQIAGLIMAVVVMIVFAVFLGKNFLYPVQVIGSGLLGESALQGLNFGAILTGLILHQAGPSLLWGAVFGIIASQFSIRTTSSALKLGLAIGIVSMVDVYLIIPAAMNALHGVDIWNREVPMFWDWAAHLVFGLSFGLYPAVLKKLSA
jgi:hypothetical protein